MLQIFDVLFVHPITNLLLAFYHLFLFLHVPFPLGFAIILLTIAIRLILWPFMAAQIKSAQKMQRVAPHIARVREKHKSDTKRQQAEMMRLYKEHGVNPAAGCLPVLIQFPILIGLYNVLTHIIGTSKYGGTIDAAVIGKINSIVYSPWLRIDPKIWNTSFFGIPLEASASALLSKYPAVILIPILTGVLQFVLSKMMIPVKDPKAQEPKTNDFAAAFQAQSLFIFPIMIGVFSFTLPLGLSLYWNTFTIFGILQQYLLVGPGGIQPWLDSVRKK